MPVLPCTGRAAPQAVRALSLHGSTTPHPCSKPASLSHLLRCRHVFLRVMYITRIHSTYTPQATHQRIHSTYIPPTTHQTTLHPASKPAQTQGRRASEKALPHGTGGKSLLAGGARRGPTAYPSWQTFLAASVRSAAGFTSPGKPQPGTQSFSTPWGRISNAATGCACMQGTGHDV